MKPILLFEGGNYNAILYLILVIMFGLPVLLTIIGLAVRKKHRKAAKVLFILATVYVLISLGICGIMISG